MTLLVAILAGVALLVARRLHAPAGTWRYVLGAALLALAASQALPPGHPFRADLRGSAVALGWLVVLAIPLTAYALWLRALRRKAGPAAPASGHPVGLVQIEDDAALMAETRAVLDAARDAAIGGPRPLSLAWRAEDGTLAGHLRMRQAGAAAEIEALVVAPRFRRQGIASRLLAAAEGEARARGLARLLATVGSWETPDVFAGAGYRALAEHDLGDGVRLLRLERGLP